MCLFFHTEIFIDKKKLWEQMNEITCCISHIDNTSITINREHFDWSESFDLSFYTFVVYITLYNRYHEMTRSNLRSPCDIVGFGKLIPIATANNEDSISVEESIV